MTKSATDCKQRKNLANWIGTYREGLSGGKSRFPAPPTRAREDGANKPSCVQRIVHGAAAIWNAINAVDSYSWALTLQYCFRFEYTRGGRKESRRILRWHWLDKDGPEDGWYGAINRRERDKIGFYFGTKLVIIWESKMTSGLNGASRFVKLEYVLYWRINLFILVCDSAFTIIFRWY